MTLLGGAPAQFSALTSRQFPEIRAGDNAEIRPRGTFDHLLMQGGFDGGAAFAVEVAGGRKSETPFWLDIQGEKGGLRLDGGAPRGLQSGLIGFLERDERVAIDEGELKALPDAAVNVAGVYGACGTISGKARTESQASVTPCSSADGSRPSSFRLRRGDGSGSATSPRP